MNPRLPTVQPWAHLLWINQIKFCTGGLFSFFFQSGHFDFPLSHFHNYACPVTAVTLYLSKLEHFAITTLNMWLLLSQFMCCFCFSFAFFWSRVTFVWTPKVVWSFSMQCLLIMPFQEWTKSQEEDHFSTLLDLTVCVDLLYVSLKVIKA